MSVLRTGVTRIDLRAGPGADSTSLIASLTKLLPALSPEGQESQGHRGAAVTRCRQAHGAGATRSATRRPRRPPPTSSRSSAALDVRADRRGRRRRWSPPPRSGSCSPSGCASSRCCGRSVPAGFAGPGAGRRGRAHRAGRRPAGVLLALGRRLPHPGDRRRVRPEPAVARASRSAGPSGSCWSVVMTVLAVLAPAFSAARVAPLEALRARRPRTPGPGSASSVAVRPAAGARRAGSAVRVRSWSANKDGDSAEILLLALIASGTLAFFALIALGPVLVRPMLGFVGWPLRRLGPVGRLAVGGVGGAPRRAAAVSVVVALGVTLIAGVLVGSSTLREYADSELAAQYPADFEATANGGPLPAGLAQKLAGRTELSQVLPYHRVVAKAGKEELSVVDVDITALPLSKKFQVKSGSLAGIGPGKVAISEMYGDVPGLKLGDKLEVATGKRKLPPGRGGRCRQRPAERRRAGRPGRPGQARPGRPDLGCWPTPATTATTASPPPGRRRSPGEHRRGSVGQHAGRRADEINSWLTGMTIVALGAARPDRADRRGRRRHHDRAVGGGADQGVRHAAGGRPVPGRPAGHARHRVQPVRGDRRDHRAAARACRTPG